MPVSYPLDVTGIDPANLIVEELYTLTAVNASPYRLLVPVFAPFYLDNFVLTHEDDLGAKRTLVPDVDYHFTLPYIAGVRSIGKMMYGAVSINDTVLNGVVKMTYQTIGGDWTADRNHVMTVLLEHNYNPVVTTWDLVTNKTDLFPPINHDQNFDYVFGHQNLIDSINSVADAVLVTPPQDLPLIDHLTDTINPHLVTKEQIGLGVIANLPLATDAEVTSRLPLEKYVTLRQVINLINSIHSGA